MIERPDYATGTSYAQQAGMVVFFAQQLNASIKYEQVEGHKTVAVVTLPDGTIKRFNVYGGFEQMTKAEAYVSRTPLWREEIQRVEDHGSMADTRVNIYFRYDAFDEDRNPIGEPTHRLACYSSHGDSILWVASTIENVLSRYKWEVARGYWMGYNITDGNVEYVYDHALQDLIQMWYVKLNKPLPGVRSEIFVFYSENEAYEFASCICARYLDAETETGTVGEATEIFEHWSF